LQKRRTKQDRYWEENFWKLLKIVRISGLTKMIKCFVWNVALYAAETWTFSKADRNGIEAFEVWIWRRICQRSVGRQ